MQRMYGKYFVKKKIKEEEKKALRQVDRKGHSSCVHLSSLLILVTMLNLLKSKTVPFIEF